MLPGLEYKKEGYYTYLEEAHGDKCKVFIPSERLKSINSNISSKLKYLLLRDDIDEVITFPDMSDDEMSLSGIYFKSSNLIYPIAAGFDVGCGFRVLHIADSKDECSEFEKKINELSNIVTGNKQLFNIDINDVHNIYENPLNFCIGKGISDTCSNLKNGAQVDLNLKSYIKDGEVLKSLGKITPGNHFVEIRYISSIINKEIAEKLGLREKDIIIMLHSGNNEQIKLSFMRHFASMYTKMANAEKIKADFNGYSIICDKDSIDGRVYINDTLKAKNLACVNREIITYLLKKELKKPLRLLLDSIHDDVEIIDNGKIAYRKGVQPFSMVKGYSLAMIPGSFNEDAFLAMQNSEMSYINHGVGEGIGGEFPSKYNVITNVKKVSKRAYYNTDMVMKTCIGLGWIEPIVKLSPWISIKNCEEYI